MTAGEFVVVQVWTPYVPSTGNPLLSEGRWLDYSRTDARQAARLLPTMGERYRAKHWITGDVLDASQLDQMQRDELKRWHSCAPKSGDHWTVTVTFDSAEGYFSLRTTVNEWNGPRWEVLIQDVSAKAASEGWTVKQLTLGD